MNQVFEEVKARTGKSVYYIPAEEDLIPNEEVTSNLSALEEIVMVGYPIGLWDKINNYPILERVILLHIHHMILMKKELLSLILQHSLDHQDLQFIL
ncbi:hypothetical protein I6H46_06570 [Anaerococcus obesiensis]|uniref:Uncharacterized protein n=1 Tax=Anaerococcus obesiensis TaxID=1287640 RepID=A0A7T7UST5_9FIRM|nr:hypothetical protein [Anaerococcus obesiensis]QQN55560.1 hypothetical protein I6H46_06570 [Anaerococcus obesiensis]